MNRALTACHRLCKPLCTAVLLCGLAPVAGHAQQVIVNAEVNQTSMPLNGMRAIFFMRLAQWPDSGRPIKVFVLDDRDPLHIQFSKQLLDVFPHQLRRSWDRMVFSGTGQAPVTVNDEAEMRQRVATTPGAIGYVNEVRDDDTVRPLAVE